MLGIEPGFSQVPYPLCQLQSQFRFILSNIPGGCWGIKHWLAELEAGTLPAILWILPCLLNF